MGILDLQLAQSALGVPKTTGLLYLRDAEVIVGKKVTNLPKEPPLAKAFRVRIGFNVEKTSEETPNKAKIFLYNLSNTSRNFLEQKNLVCFLKAGYRDSISTIFFGDVIRQEVRRAGPDIITMLECGDSELTITQSRIELSLAAGATNLQVIAEAAKKLGVSAGAQKGLVTKSYPRGFSYSGPVRQLMNELTRRMGVQWSIQDGELRILPLKGNDNQEVVLVSPETGLIGFPTKTTDGIQFKSLLNPAIRPGRAVKVESKQFQWLLAGGVAGLGASGLKGAGAVVTAQRVTFEGDTHDGQWITTVEGVVSK